jgi:PAS domain S-box-containing protein
LNRRPPIILRASAIEAEESPLVVTEDAQRTTPAPSTPAPAFSGDANAEIARLNEKIEKYKRSLQQWTQAEVDWNSQRRLFELMTENISDLIVLTNREGNRLWSNAAYNRVMGFSAGELAGTYVLTEVHANDQGRALEAFNYAILQGVAKKVEYRAQKKSGIWVTLTTETIPITNTEGKTESVLLISSDITDHKRLTEELSTTSNEATTMKMVEAMAHDFDQILTNVVGNLTIAKNLNGPHNAIAIRLSEIERSLQRARDLIEQMFSMAPGEGQPKVRVGLEAALEDPVAGILRGTMVRAEYLFPRHLPDLELDVEAFAHAIRNIVTNSLQSMDKGVIRFTAEVLSSEQVANRPDLPLRMGEYICLRIQDQGHGISEKALPRVFEPYFTTRKGSQGLGLTRALSTIQRMGGTILLESTPGVGTIVSLYIPTAVGEAPVEIDQTPDAALPAPSPTRTGSVTTRTGSLAMRTGSTALRTGSTAMRTGSVSIPKAGGHKSRILLMDDEQMILDIVSRMLGHLGYDVTTCTDGSQAIAAFAKAKSQSEPFDVVMMDLVIPNGVGGEDAVKTIKKIDPTAKVIASSGHLDHAVMTDHNKFGFNAVLEKPYKLEKLQQVIEAVINAPA